VRRSPVVLREVLAVLLAALVLGGCGGAGESAAAPSSPSSPASPVTDAPPEPGAPGLEPAPDALAIVSVLATEIRRRGKDGSVEEGDMVEPEPYEAVFAPALGEITRCARDHEEPTLIVNVAPSGAVSEVEAAKNAPPCLSPLVQKLSFPAAKHPVALVVMVTP
jgi:hypothetical protein